MENRGITLIALVITIIVLLILAGISIAMLTGENGIITKAQEAKRRTEEAEKEEQENLQRIAESIDGVTQVNDPTPGGLEGNGTKTNPYKIQSIEDLVVFAYEVTNGRNFIKEDGTKEYVELDQSLDFQSDKSYINPEREDYEEYGYNGKLKEVLNSTGFIPIGITIAQVGQEVQHNAFNGVFEGNGYKIYNLKLEKNIALDYEAYVETGMFGYNYGVIQNLGIEKGNVYTGIESQKFSAIALLVGTNHGEIRNCYSTGEVTVKTTKFSCNVGGLVGSNSGKIQECYNTAKVKAINNGEVQIRLGGVVGANETESILENVYNTGDILGIMQGKSVSTHTILVGGVLGLNYGTVKGTYNIGEVSNQRENEDRVVMGSIIAQNLAKIENCYYLENTVVPSDENIEITIQGEQKTSEAMKQNDFVEDLNSGNETSMWKINSNQNQGYPILYWQ